MLLQETNNIKDGKILGVAILEVYSSINNSSEIKVFYKRGHVDEVEKWYYELSYKTLTRKKTLENLSDAKSFKDFISEYATVNTLYKDDGNEVWIAREGDRDLIYVYYGEDIHGYKCNNGSYTIEYPKDNILEVPYYKYLTKKQYDNCRKNVLIDSFPKGFEPIVI